MSNVTIANTLDRNAVLYTNRAALECDGRVVTHAQLRDRALRIGNVLAARGAEPGDRIAMLARNAIELVEVQCACELHGFIAVPLNHRLAVAEIEIIIQDCAPKALVTDDEFSSVGRALCTAPPARMSLLIMGETQAGNALEPLLHEASTHPPEHRPAAEDPAYIIYTSGSTGRPKGAMHSHKGLIASGRLLAATACVRPDSTQLVIMPLFHVGAIAHRMAYVVSGGKLVLHRQFDGQHVAEALASGLITDIHLAPTMLRSVLDAAEGRNLDFSSIDSVKYASSPIPDDTLDRAMHTFGGRLIQYYALTEAGGIGSVLPRYVHEEARKGQHPARLRSAGQPHFGCEIRIADPHGRFCEAGQEGEVWLRSDAVMTGYWNNTDLSREVLVDGWLRTGDIGKLDDNHYLFIMDRQKDMIVSGGENIYSSEVERALESHPAVLEAAVIAVPDEQWGEAVHACVVLRPGFSITEAALIEYCRSRIASYKKPRTIEFLDALPRLQHVQKIDKTALRRPYWDALKRAVN